MTATVILGPAKAAEMVCHEEQLRIWAHDNIIGALALGGYLRDDLSYHESIEMEHDIMRELRRIIEMAFDHPEAKTIRRA
ncbi:MAG: hypothetical protein IT537_03085 [Hyphomicrobiales bacterium]|nr:hypothetical protein [Hyphomicrobiales bacterium]